VQYVVAVVVGLVLAEVATLITTIYLHRVLSHKSIRLHPALTMFMRLVTWMLTSISPREWVAVHRKHHNFSDVEGDPHSPHIEGYWKIMLANVSTTTAARPTTTIPWKSTPRISLSTASTRSSSVEGSSGSA
jgi:fatty-acid desaturase